MHVDGMKAKLEKFLVALESTDDPLYRIDEYQDDISLLMIVMKTARLAGWLAGLHGWTGLLGCSKHVHMILQLQILLALLGACRLPVTVVTRGRSARRPPARSGRS